MTAPSPRPPTRFIDHARPGNSLRVSRVDRLDRSVKKLLEVVEDLEARSNHLVSLTGDVDTLSAAGNLVFHELGAIAHCERRLIAKPTRDDIAANRKHGRKPGSPPLPREEISATKELFQVEVPPGHAAKQLTMARQQLTGSRSRSLDPRCARSVPSWSSPAFKSCDYADSSGDRGVARKRVDPEVLRAPRQHDTRQIRKLQGERRIQSTRSLGIE